MVEWRLRGGGGGFEIMNGGGEVDGVGEGVE